MRKIIHRLFHLLLVSLFAGLVFHTTLKAQETENMEAGIAEKLSDTIPLQLKFLNEKGDTVTLKDLVNKPTILVMIYFACPGICPTMLNGISDMIERSDMTLGKEFRIITVSMNEDDKPAEAGEKKQNYLREKSLPYASDWIYLTGDSLAIHTLTNSIGYYFKRTGNDFIHPSVIIVLSPEGKITRYLYGTSFLPFDVKMAIVEAQKGQARPTINRVLEYCFSYDPEGRKYTLQVTKVTATIIIFFALILFLYLLIRSGRRKAKKSDPGSVSQKS